jgi:protease-4
MKQFFKYFFASALGTFFAFALIAILSLVFISVMLLSESTKKNYSPILKINLNGIISEKESFDPMSLAFFKFGIKQQGLNDILSAIKEAKYNAQYKGIYLNLGFVQAGISAMQEIRNALLDFKESGKFVVAYGEMVSQKSYYAASVADKIVFNPLGMLEFKGLGDMRQYNRGVFEKMGIEMQVFKVGEYKSYTEPYTSYKMSDYDKEQKSVYLKTLWGEILSGISESREIPIDSLERYADEYLLFSAPESLVKYKLVDSLSYKLDFENSLKEMAGIKKEKELKCAKVSEALNDYQLKSGAKNAGKIAVLYAEGSIVGDEEADLYSGSVIASKAYLKELKKLQKDSSVKAVVFRVNSSGGSAYASDQIWHGIRELSKVKPVVASLGSYAASGGYYIACGANKIVSSPTTLTGSIGIFGLFPSGEKLVNKVGAVYDGVGTNKNTLFGEQVLSIPFLEAGILPARPLNESEYAMLQAFVERGYGTFLSRCAEGRGMSVEALDSIGRGRVWAGAKAFEIGLADTLGGFETALEMAANLANLEDYYIEEFPKLKDPFDRFFEEMFGYTKLKILEFVLGKDGYETVRLFNALSNYDYRQAISLH